MNLLKARIDPLDSGEPSKTESYTYYPNGLMKTIKDRNGVTTTYTYDIFGRLLSENAGGEIQSYTFDNNGNELTMTDASGTTSRTYDALNRVITKTVPTIGITNYQYGILTNNQGEIKERITNPKGNVTEKTYDKVGRLSNVSLVKGSGNNEDTSYEYYENGNRRKVTYPDGTTET